MLRSIWLISKSVPIEAVRRKEIYAIVLLAVAIIGAVMSMDFFGLEGLTKFYREIALLVMSVSTGITVIVLAARQLPREFENRTVYPLLAKPISRVSFLLGKLLGVMMAAAFCYLLFMTVYLLGVFYGGGNVPWILFSQYIYLQLCQMLVLATMSFTLSMLMNVDAAVTLGGIFYLGSSVISSAITIIYKFADPMGKKVLVVFNYVVPQLSLFDLSEKLTHAGDGIWSPLSLTTLAQLTAYGLVFSGIFFCFSVLAFRRKAL